jgi:hypothetical protein
MRVGQKTEDLTPAAAHTLEMQLQAWDMHVGGASYVDIGRALDITDVWARKLVMRTASHIKAELEDAPADEKLFMVERLHNMLVRFYKNALAGDEGAGRMVISANKQLMELLGLAANRQVDITGHLSPAEMEGILEELKELVRLDAGVTQLENGD